MIRTRTISPWEKDFFSNACIYANKFHVANFIKKELEVDIRFRIRMVKCSQIKEITKSTNTINRHIEYILIAWHIGRTDAVTESLNSQIKDIIRECRRSAVLRYFTNATCG